MTEWSKSEGEHSDRATDQDPAPADIRLPSSDTSACGRQEPTSSSTERSSSPASVTGRRTSSFNAALRRPLPASRATTSSETSTHVTRSPSPVSVAGRQQSSFDVAVETTLPASDASSAIHGTDTPSVELLIVRPEDDAETILEDIWNGDHRYLAGQLEGKIRQMSEWLPHLRILFPPEDQKAFSFGRIKTYHMDQEGTFLRSIDDFTMEDRTSWVEVRDHFSRTPLKKNTSRIIVVEDLNSIVMTGLYAAFGLGPEIFADHLNRSGYGLSTYEDPDPSTWNFRSVSKSYVSLRWFRAVYKLEKTGMPTAARVNFEKLQHAKWEEKRLTTTVADEQPRRARVTHEVQRHTNIFRQQRPLSASVTPSPGKGHGDTLATIEERVTLHKVQRNGYELSKCCESHSRPKPHIIQSLHLWIPCHMFCIPRRWRSVR